MTVKEFYEKNKGNEVLKEKIRNCKSIEETYELVKSNGLTDSLETFKHDAGKVVMESGDLTEEEIASISAGNEEGCTGDSWMTTIALVIWL